MATPWGDSDSLRERRLHPGPGTSPEDVAKNQRERLFAAMVTAVAQKGYEATRVDDLIEISGTSKKSFYEHFDNKQACFIATLEQLLAGLTFALADSGKGEREWNEFLIAAADAFAGLITALPAAARFVLSDAYAAGPEAWSVLDRWQAAFEARLSARVSQSLRGEELPSGLITALIGAGLEITRTRLREGNPAGLVAELPGLMEWMTGYPPPPKPLRLATRPPTFGPESTKAHDDSERALRAFALVVAERGYAGTTIHEIARRGSMSPTTFYANFRDKHDALLAAIDSVMAQLAVAANSAMGRSPDWARGVRVAIGSMLNLLASRPAMAHLLTVDIFAGGDEAMRRRSRGAQPLAALLAEGIVQAPTVPAITAEAMAGGITALIRKRLLEKGSKSLPGLAPLCTYIVLAPICGAETASEVANGDGRGGLRRGGGRPPTATQAVDEPVGTVSCRSNAHLSRRHLTVDEQGWDQLGEIHRKALHEVEKVAAESLERLRGSGDQSIDVTSLQACFEIERSSPRPGDLGTPGERGRDPEA